MNAKNYNEWKQKINKWDIILAFIPFTNSGISEFNEEHGKFIKSFYWSKKKDQQ